MAGSIRLRLLLLLLSLVLVLWTAVFASTYRQAMLEVDHHWDQELEHIARLVATATRHEARERDFPQYQDDLEQHLATYDVMVAFQVWGPNGKLVVRSPNAPERPFLRGARGFHRALVDGAQWHVLAMPLGDLGYEVQVGQSEAQRVAYGRATILSLLTPLLFGLPLMGVLMWAGVRRGLTPLHRLAGHIAERDRGNLEPIPETSIPLEVRPLVRALNSMLDRIRESFDHYNRFTADAAHELRTPLAGIRIQAQAALRSRDEAERQHSLEQVVVGVDRATHLVEQLLLLARIAPDEVAQGFVATNIADIARDVVGEMHLRAGARSQALALDAGLEITVMGSADLLAALLRNLLDNALRCSPEGSAIRVEVREAGGTASVIVEDSGPGIPAAERERVFARFYRLDDGSGPGCGLGLSIVSRIAALHRGTVALTDGAGGRGLRVCVDLPAARIRR